MIDVVDRHAPQVNHVLTALAALNVNPRLVFPVHLYARQEVRIAYRVGIAQNLW